MQQIKTVKVFVREGPPLDQYPSFAMRVSDALRMMKELGAHQQDQMDAYWFMANAAIRQSGIGSTLDQRGGPYVLFPGYKGSDDFDTIPTPVFFFKQDNGGETTVVSFHERLTFGDVREEAEVTFITEQRVDVKILKADEYEKARRSQQFTVEAH